MTKNTINISQCKDLLETTTKIIQHQQEIEKLKGEKFNVFSILEMEHLEDKLHSKFIRELLDPKGSHLKEGLFLQLFIKQLNENHPEAKKIVEPTYSEAIREFYIGETNLDEKTGGRIDIFLKDAAGNTICIENKIFAGDQPAQLQRYCNYNGKKNRVYYLTLDGRGPSEGSAGKLIVDQDYFLISYEKDIVDWLEACLKEVYDEPILRESIKQYLIVIKKLTNSVEEETYGPFSNLLVEKFEEAKYIRDHFDSVFARVRMDFKKDFAQAISRALIEDSDLKEAAENLTFDLTGVERQDKLSPFWIVPDNQSDLQFGVEPFNITSYAYEGGEMFIGVFPRSEKARTSYPPVDQGETIPTAWLASKRIKFNDKVVRLDDSDVVKIIQDLKSQIYIEFRAALVKQVIDFMKSVLEVKGILRSGFLSKK
jgi:hypothetical protein